MGWGCMNGNKTIRFFSLFLKVKMPIECNKANISDSKTVLSDMDIYYSE